MSIYKEKILTAYLCKNKEIIEFIIQRKIKKIYCEKYLVLRKIDIYAKTEDDIDVYIEIQLTKSDNNHFNQIMYIANHINKKDKSILIWIAKDIDEKYLYDLSLKIANTNKSIQIIGLSINQKILDELKTLSEINYIDIFNNFYLLDQIKNKFNIVFVFECNLVGYKKKKIKKEIKYKDNFLKKLLTKMRKDIPYYLAIYNWKDITKNRIVLGTGMSEIRLHIGTNSFKRKVYIELQVDNKNVNDKYNIFKTYITDFENLINRKIICEDRLKKVTVELDMEESEKMIDECIEIIDLFLKNMIYK